MLDETFVLAFLVAKFDSVSFVVILLAFTECDDKFYVATLGEEF